MNVDAIVNVIKILKLLKSKLYYHRRRKMSETGGGGKLLIIVYRGML